MVLVTVREGELEEVLEVEAKTVSYAWPIAAIHKLYLSDPFPTFLDLFLVGFPQPDPADSQLIVIVIIVVPLVAPPTSTPACDLHPPAHLGTVVCYTRAGCGWVIIQE